MRRLVLASAFVAAVVCVGAQPCHGISTSQTATAAPQPEWEFRLVNLTDPGSSQGLLEARAGPNGTWGTVCAWSMGPIGADAACGSVGFPGGKGTIIYDMPPADTQNLTVNIGDISCAAGSATLADCNVTSQYADGCSPTQAFGLHCSLDPVWEARIVPQNATLHNNRGLLQVRPNGTGQWGWVCSWNALNAATPACHSAGFPNTTAATIIPFYGGGVGPMFMDSLQCGDDAINLNNCDYEEASCNPTQAMGVDCSTTPGPRPTVLFNATVSTSATQFVSNMELVLNVPVDMVVVVNVTQLNNSSATGPLNAVVFYLTNQNGDLNRHDMTELEKSLIDVSPTLLSSLNALALTNNNTDGIIDTMQFRLVDGATATSGLLQMRPFPEADWGTVYSRQATVGPVDPNVLAAMCCSAGVVNPTPAVAQELHRLRLHLGHRRQLPGGRGGDR
jgi:hypothetical protein